MGGNSSDSSDLPRDLASQDREELADIRPEAVQLSERRISDRNETGELPSQLSAASFVCSDDRFMCSSGSL